MLDPRVLDMIEDLLEEVLLGLLERGLAEDLQELLARDPERMRRRADVLDASGHGERAMRLRARADRVEARR